MQSVDWIFAKNKGNGIRLLFLLLVVLFLSIRWRDCSSAFWENVGWLNLSQAVSMPTEDRGEALALAEGYLRKAVDAGPENCSAWRGWGYVLSYQGRAEEATLAWNMCPGMAEELIERGLQAQKNGLYEQALVWYRRAIALDPQDGDLWVQMALMSQQAEHTQEALLFFDQATSRPLDKTGRSDIFYYIGSLHLKETEPPDFYSALAALDTAIEINRFSEPSLQVQCHYLRAEVLRHLDFAEKAWEDYAWVVARQPEHYWAHVYLGQLYWQIYRNADLAEEALFAATLIEPDLKWAYYQLAQIYQETGQICKAKDMYERVLELDPTDERAVNGLRDLEGKDD